MQCSPSQKRNQLKKQMRKQRRKKQFAQTRSKLQQAFNKERQTNLTQKQDSVILSQILILFKAFIDKDKQEKRKQQFSSIKTFIFQTAQNSIYKKLFQFLKKLPFIITKMNNHFTIKTKKKQVIDVQYVLKRIDEIQTITYFLYLIIYQYFSIIKTNLIISKTKNNFVFEVTNCLVEISCFQIKQFILNQTSNEIRQISLSFKQLLQQHIMKILCQLICFQGLNTDIFANAIYACGNILTTQSHNCQNIVQKKRLSQVTNMVLKQLISQLLLFTITQQNNQQIIEHINQQILLVIWLLRNKLLYDFYFSLEISSWLTIIKHVVLICKKVNISAKALQQTLLLFVNQYDISRDTQLFFQVLSLIETKQICPQEQNCFISINNVLLYQQMTPPKIYQLISFIATREIVSANGYHLCARVLNMPTISSITKVNLYSILLINYQKMLKDCNQKYIQYTISVFNLLSVMIQFQEKQKFSHLRTAYTQMSQQINQNPLLNYQKIIQCLEIMSCIFQINQTCYTQQCLKLLIAIAQSNNYYSWLKNLIQTQGQFHQTISNLFYESNEYINDTVYNLFEILEIQ